MADRRTLLIMCLAAGITVGCQTQAGSGSAEVTAIGGGSQCGTDQPGLELIRDAEHLPSTGRDKGRDAIEAGDAVLKVAIGQRPTGGYGAELTEAELETDRLALALAATEPDPDAMVSQVITTPCVVLRVPDSGWSEVAVSMDAEGFPLTLEHPNPG